MLRSAIVCVDAQGVIRDIETPVSIDSMAGVEHYSGMLVPGFVNAHSHLELSYLCSAIESGGGFTAFAAAMRAVRGGFTEHQRCVAAAFHDAKMWAEGVDVVADICNGDTTFDLKRSSKIKYVNFLELFGLQSESAEQLDGVADSARKFGLRYTVTPHSTYSLNRKAFNSAIDAAHKADSRLPLSIHFMESPAEAELYDGRGEMWEWYRKCGFATDFLQYGSPARRIVECIPPDRRIMLIHNCYVSSGDVQMLCTHFGTNLTWVLCPRSNDYISGVTPPIELLQRSGARIAVGTDSLASNRSLSMIDELRFLGDLPLTTLIEWATIGGAEALGMDDEYGSIEIGKRCGLVLLKDLDWDRMKLTEKSTSQRIL